MIRVVFYFFVKIESNIYIKMAAMSDTTRHVNDFWTAFSTNWHFMYKVLMKRKYNDMQRMLNLAQTLLGPLSAHIDLEFTIGEINRVEYDIARDLVELYISPKLLVGNIPIMKMLYETRPKLDNLHVCMYRAYNVKDPVIATVAYGDISYDYSDFGCQTFYSMDEHREPVVNIVMYIKKRIAEHLLVKKEVTFVNPETKQETKLLKWLPAKTNVVDILLTNIIGEYNLIKKVGYIEFLVEDDDIIMEGSQFVELSELRKSFAVIKYRACRTCGKCEHQGDLYTCTGCSKAIYCSRLCQRIDFANHKQMCT
jgi:hypothetical protein